MLWNPMRKKSSHLYIRSTNNSISRSRYSFVPLKTSLEAQIILITDMKNLILYLRCEKLQLWLIFDKNNLCCRYRSMLLNTANFKNGAEYLTQVGKTSEEALMQLCQ